MRLFGWSPRTAAAEVATPLATPPPRSNDEAPATVPELAPLPRAHVSASDEPRPGSLAALVGAHRAPIAAALLGASGWASVAAVAAPVSAAPAAAEGAWVTRPQVMRELAQMAEHGVDAAEVARLRALLAGDTLTPGARDAIVVLLSKSGQASVEPGRVHSLGLASRVDGGTRGAYFRKVTSTADVHHRGIHARGVLPRVHFDPARAYVSPHGLDHFQTGPLDRPSVYLGGRTGGVEMDVGLTWDRVYDGARATYTDRADGTDGRDAAHRFVRAQVGGQPALLDGHGAVVALGADAVAERMMSLSPNFAFRPVWRAISGGHNDWGTPELGSPSNVYFYPGERFDMRVEVVGKNRVTLSIAPIDVPGAQGMSHTFAQDGAGVGAAQSFKRVTSLDQFYVRDDGSRKGREGQDVLPTATVALGGGWTSVEVLRDGGGVLPLRGELGTEVKGGDLAARYDRVFHRYALNAAGGERVDIVPPR